MLILTRKVGESIVIGDDIRLTVLGVKGYQVRIGFAAPENITVHRQEIYERIHTEMMAAHHEDDYAEDEVQERAEKDAERLATLERNDGRG